MRLIEDYDARVAKTSRELRRLVPADAYNWCEVDTTVVSGVPHRSILATAAEIQADLIVIAGNPGADIADIHKVEIVFKQGIGFDPAKLVASVTGRVGLW